MQNLRRVAFLHKILILAAVVGAVLFSWLLGHILRFSIPSLWHPPVRQSDPPAKVGGEFEFEGLRRLAVLPGAAQAASMPEPGARPEGCAGLIYFASLPAKCLTADGRLVAVPGFEPRIMIIPESK